ncbi:hypothetical protein JDV02_003068 [Purpureocillium takamizusanense]|uniref:Galactose oxidase n=1 Tax=Purpureocillium takamizusanense TaxID=2060973 RepID=A0A9Q8QC78_9HYPO|nr:uncharacterized protein JDV02_003068 [Purpureocillium takamizusanense]UNI16648.1 hypothetical protein JDV02_003068 [Purpureocillium takamizusanense]
MEQWSSSSSPAIVSAAAEQAHAFPYVPTQILTPSACVNQSSCRGRDVAYVFSPSSSTSRDGVRFLALNYSSGIDAGAEPKPVSTTASLPFLQDAESATTAFGAARAASGEVLVFAGACDGPGGDVWSYTPGGNNGDDKDVKWQRRTTTRKQGGAAGGSTQGPYFLGGTLAFSSKLAPTMDEPTLYTYGGMCAPPSTSTAKTQDWQSNANYTKTMMSLSPAAAQDGGYNLGVASVLGPRSPFAGFSVTQLPPSVTNISGTVTQQASFVFLGGHTQWAFINMSTAAVWSLPEETWSYVNVQPPSPPPSTAAGEIRKEKKAAVATTPDNVYSRSGHTAVLSEDGGSVVVLGGWVGDVGTPAEPQLAVLEMSQAYSSWRWRIPETQPESGIYGHGAAMLPGNVMVVYGGWETKNITTTTTKQKRQDAPATASSLRFLNLTSMAWTSSYTNPHAAGRGGGGDDESHDAPGSDGSSKSRRLGLGLGLGLGLALLLGVVFGFLLWRMRQRRKQARHDEAVRAMAEDARHFLHDGDMMERDDFLFGWGGQRDWRTGGQQQQGGDGRSLGYESLRGAAGGAGGRASLDAGSSSIARKPLAGGGATRGMMMRNGYQPALPADGGRFSGTFASPPGVIHPILEDDEDEYYGHDEQHENEHEHANLASAAAAAPLTPTSEAHSDPFATPVTATAPPVIFFPTTAAAATGGGLRTSSPDSRGSNNSSPVRRTDPDVQDWVSDVDAADALLARYSSTRQQHQQQQQQQQQQSSSLLQQGRVSPTRRGSNRSTLTLGLRDDDSRTGSNLSESARSAADSLRRSASGRRSGGFLLGLGLGGGGEHSKPGSSSSSSYNTARSGFGALQAEAPGLLMGSSGGGARTTAPASPTGWGGGAATGDHNNDDDDEYALPPGSPSKSKPPSRRTWLGSLRRVFSGSGSGSSGASPASASREELDSHQHHQYQQASSGAALMTAGAGALSGELLRRKQGRHDWQDSGDEGGGGSSTVGMGAAGRRGRRSEHHGGDDDDGAREKDEWDIERAVEQRLVQVMFTVPKERLRVVNAAADDGDDDNEDDDDNGGADNRALGKPPVTVTAQQRGQEHVAPAEALREPHVAELVDPSSTDTSTPTTTTTKSSLRSAASREGGLRLAGEQQQRQEEGGDATTATQRDVGTPGAAGDAANMTAIVVDTSKDVGGVEDKNDKHDHHHHHHDHNDEKDDEDEDVHDSSFLSGIGSGDGGSARAKHQSHAGTVSSGGGDYLGVMDGTTTMSNPRLSHSTDGSSWRGDRSSGVFMTAEAVTFERPRMRMTRVRDMVDRYETRSAEASPVRSQADSPTRGTHRSS